jgi:hypothetical protein
MAYMASYPTPDDVPEGPWNDVPQLLFEAPYTVDADDVYRVRTL